MFNDYQFPATAFHAMQWPVAGVTSEAENVLTGSSLAIGLGIGIGCM